MSKFKLKLDSKKGRLLYKSHAYTKNKRVYWNAVYDWGN
jgi:hypothetical protein